MKRRMAVLMLCAFLPALARAGEAENKKEITRLKAEVASLKIQIRMLRSALDSLQRRVKKLEKPRIVIVRELASGEEYKLGAKERAVVKSLRTYCSGQIVYHRYDWDKDGVLEYATPFTALATTKSQDGKPIELIDKAMAAAAGAKGKAKDGYLFQDMAAIAGVKINWIDDYALCATPAKYGVETKLTFIISTSGTVWAKDLGKAAFMKLRPRNPAKSGWVRVK